MTKQNTTAEHWRLQLIAAACALQHATGTESNVIPLPGTDCFVAIGTAARIGRLLAAAPLADCDHVDSEGGHHD